MKNKISLIFLLFAILAVACKPDPVDTTGGISGTIRDAIDNSVIQGASVTLSPSGKTTVTGNDGHYQFMDVELGDYTVSVTKANYESTSQKASVQVGRNTTLDFTLHRANGDIVVTPLTLDFGETDTNLAIDIQNNGQATMQWQVSENETWLSCTPTSGEVQAGKKTSITVTVDRTGLSRDTYTNTLTITSNNGGSQIVRVTMTVQADNPNLPQVSMIDVNGVTDIAATLSGTILSIGNARVIAHGFCWGTQENPSLENGSHNDLGPTETPKDFSYNLSNLTPNQHYFVRAYAKNSAGIVYSSKQLDFTTLSVQGKATVETGAASQVASRSATIAGTISDLGCEEGVTQYGHVWSDVAAEPTIDYQKTELGEMKQTGSFTSSLTNLKPNTLYYVRAYARNKYGINYGAVIQVKTLVAEVKLETLQATNVLHDGATCGGSIIDYGGHTITECGICWSTNGNPTIANSHAIANVSPTFSVRLSNLTEQTFYYYRAYVKTETGDTYYGSSKSFTTSHIIYKPSLSEVSISAVSHKRATFIAKVLSLGNGNLKQSGFCYSTSHNPTVENSILDCGTDKDMQATTTTLLPETTYYVRAFAKNESGVGYSEEKTFTTSAKPEWEISRDDWNSDENWN